MGWLELDDYQLDAIKRMKNGCILCGGTGSGKSRTALAYYYQQNEGDLSSDTYVPMNNPPRDLYIITTAFKRDTLEWEAELVPFLLYTNKENNLYANKVIIDSWNNIKKYQKVMASFFIFDEQRVVGSGAWVKAFLKIARKNRWILLSATPGDTWMDYVPVFIANGFYNTRKEFKQEHVIYKPYTKYPVVDRYIGQGKLQRYRQQILVEMDYKKDTVQHHEDINVKYDIKKYKDLIRHRWNPYTNKPINNASEFCYLQRKIVNSDESRQVALLELFEQHPKLIIFYNFDYELEILRDLFKNNYSNITIAERNGHKHETVPNTGSWVYLVQYDSGAEAWNCITTDAIVFYSQTYSYKKMKQASGRIDRRNTPYKDLYYYHFKSKSGIDLAINRAIKTKRDFNYRSYSRRYSFFKKEDEND